MHFLRPGIREDPVRRWNLPDRVFFGRGACHILAGVYLQSDRAEGFWAEWIVPHREMKGTHIYVTNGTVAFDFHGYCCRESLLAYHTKGWSLHTEGWEAEVVLVEFDLLNTKELNARRMKGPDQYLHDVIPRAEAFLERHASKKKHDRAMRHSA